MGPTARAETRPGLLRRGAAEDLVPVAAARALVLADVRPLAPVRLPLQDALGLVTAERVVAGQPVPPFANSAVDGYALRARDSATAPVTLHVVGELMAGAHFAGTIGDGEALRIMTGAPMPDGADAVCMVERADGEPGGPTVGISYALAPGENVRRAGSDVARGDAVFERGSVLGAGSLGVLASIGCANVLVVPRPRVGVLSTGDELVGPGKPLAPGKIRESNRVALLALVAQSGFIPVDLGTAGDDEAEVAAALDGAVGRCDALLTSGGVSVGDRDVVRDVLARRSGGSMRWLQIAMRPAKPFAFGLLPPADLPVFGLPGNPVSALVSFEVFARPALRAMAGHRRLDRPVVVALAEEDLPRRADGKLHLVRCVARHDADGRTRVRSAGGQESHQLHAMAQANALALLPDGTGARTGDDVAVLLLDPEPDFVPDGASGTGPASAGAPWT